MRTTITIDERLLDRLKKKATSRRTTVSKLIEEAVRLSFQDQTSPKDTDFHLVTYGQGGTFPGINLEKSSSLIELDDVSRYSR